MKNLLLITLLFISTFSIGQTIISVPDTANVVITKKKVKGDIVMQTKYTYGDIVVRVQSQFIDSIFNQSIDKKTFAIQEEIRRIKSDSIYLAKDLKRVQRKLDKRKEKLLKLKSIKDKK